VISRRRFLTGVAIGLAPIGAAALIIDTHAHLIRNRRGSPAATAFAQPCLAPDAPTSSAALAG
jgi:hypothetical protein